MSVLARIIDKMVHQSESTPHLVRNLFTGRWRVVIGCTRFRLACCLGPLQCPLESVMGFAQRMRGARRPLPGAPVTLPFSYTTSPRRMVVIGHPVISQPAKIVNFEFEN